MHARSVRMVAALLALAVLGGCGGGVRSASTGRSSAGRSELAPHAAAAPTRSRAGLGDLNGLGHPDVGSATKILRVVVGLDAAPGDITAWDCNVSGQIDVGDATKVLRWVVGLDPWQATRGKWTLIIYLNGANNLEEYGPLNINQLEQYADSNDVRIVVLMKRIVGYDTSNGNWTDVRRFQVRHDDQPNLMTSSLLGSEGGSAVSLGQIDMGDPNTLHDFIGWAQANYPADHYLLDIWNHGSGWRPVDRAAGGGTRGISFDDQSGNYIRTHQLTAAVTAATKLDIILMDSSLMQMAEVLYQMRGQADYIVGSEESPPGEGYPYQLLFTNLMADPSRSAENICRDIVNEFVAVTGTTSSVTQSAFRTAGLPALLNALNLYAQTLTTKDALYHTQIGLARAATQRYGHGASLYEGDRDLVDFLNQVTTRTGDAALQNAADTVKQALLNAMVVEDHTGTDLALSHGLAIFAPLGADWAALRGDYRLQAFAIDGLWDEFWDTYYRLNR